MANAIDLPYAKDALEPHIDKETMELHYEKHYMGYTKKYNMAVQDTEFEGKDVSEVLADLDAVPEEIRTAVRNNGGGYLNHTMFWETMSPDGGGEPDGQLGEEITKVFGSFQDFKQTFQNTATSVFGSGWAWLTVDSNGLFVLRATSNQDTPVSDGLRPILMLDVWEHAYYLKNRNRRAEYVEAWWNVVNWDKVAELYAAGL